MDVAELYLSMIRPNGVPVVGECVAEGFVGQIQVERWNWNLMNDEEIHNAEEDQKDYDNHRELLTKQPTVDLRKKLQALNDKKAAKARADARISAMETYSTAMQGKGSAAEKAKAEKAFGDSMKKIAADEAKETYKAKMAMEGLSRDLTRQERKTLEDLDKQVAEYADDLDRDIHNTTDAIADGDKAHAKANKSYEFSFSKRVDFSTTQLLNSMKAGDVFPLAVLTIHQRSSNAGMSLVFTVTQLRLLDYSLRADVSETMTDMKEQWKAEFRSLAYVYKNRRAIESSDDAVEAGAKAATQGTVRTFAMKKDLGI